MNSNKIKILHLVASNCIGGAERVLLTLSRNIDREKFDLVLGIFVDQRQSLNLLWKEAEKLNLPLEPIRFKNPHSLFQILQICRIIKKYRPDIIHTHGYKTNIFGFLAAKLYGIPITTTVHGLYRVKIKTTLIVQLSLILLNYFDRIIVVSDQIKAELQKMKLPSEKIMTIRNVPPLNIEEHSLNVSAFREEIGIPSNTNVIGFVGRLEQEKGCSQFIQAASIIVAKKKDICFVIVGEGSERKSLEDQVKRLGLEKWVHFCGFRCDMASVFSALNLYVLSSLNEGVPLALLEAMFYRVPVVATRVGGVPEVIQNGVNGMLVSPNDPLALAESILESLANVDDTAKRALEAKKTIDREYNVNKWIDIIGGLYKELTIKH